MPADLQAALTVLARRKLENERDRPIVLDLSGANLQYADFFGSFQGAVLHSADLRGAHLHEIDLREAKLAYTRLEWATFDGADLQGTFFHGAHLETTTFTRCNVRDAKELDSVWWDGRTTWSPPDFRPPSNNPRPTLYGIQPMGDSLAVSTSSSQR
jgi:uncharacterized protein YjbI with pentapeptide repeats